MTKKTLFTKNQIQNRVEELGYRMTSDLYKYKEDIIFVCVLNGAIFFFSDLCKSITMLIKLDFIRASSYGSQMTSSGFIKFTKEIDIDIEDKIVVIVDDIVDEGLTMHHIIKKIKRDKPKDIKVCTLINKLERRKYDIQIDYYGFEITKGFVVGYGLDFNEKYRNLEHIYLIEEK